MKRPSCIVLPVFFFLQSFLFASTDCPQNIIFIIVDGGGFNHFRAAEIYEKKTPSFKKFPVKLAVTTYPAGGSYDPKWAAEDFNYVRTGYTDSAAAATAMSTGFKTSNGLIGLDVNENRLEHIIERCEKLGISTGIVTSKPVWDATPAGFVAHQKSRRAFAQIASDINQVGLEVLFGLGEKLPLNQNEPNLSEMTKAALDILDDDPNGFFIMIEAGFVDSASHDNNIAVMIEEMINFHNAVDVVINWVEQKSSWQKSLVIVTADHETGYLIVAAKKDLGQKPDMQWHSKDHTNSLVPFYAKGQGVKLFAERIKGKDPVYGSYIDNTDIAKVIFSLLEQKAVVKK